MISRRFIRLLLALIALVLIGSWGLSGALRYGWGRRALLARLSASFGRPVEVQVFSFRLLSGPSLIAQSVTVSEDSRFGGEYFLRADELTAGLRLASLLRGRIEFGTLSLSHPSLNLVHSPTGHWNVESWLPSPNTTAADLRRNTQGSARGDLVGGQGRLGHIQVDEGRINFKLGPEKLLFALVGVSGHLDQDGTGRWSIDLEASPMRASVSLQDTGRLRLRGNVAGTSARLRPARLQLTWDKVSLADALRLARGSDYGVRGTLGAELLASIDDGAAGPDASGGRHEWMFSGTVRLAGLHRWDLPARAGDPAVNLALAATWRADAAHLDVSRLTLESPHSQLVATGDLNWSHGFSPSLQIVSSQIALSDLLDWPHSFRPGLSKELTADGTLSLQGAATGWPLRIGRASVSSAGLTLRTGGAGREMRVGQISAELRRNALVLAPVSVTLPGAPVVATARARPENVTVVQSPPAGTLRVEGVLGPFPPSLNSQDWTYRLGVSGQTTRVEDLTALWRATGQSPGADWSAEGAATFQMSWNGAARREGPALTGKLGLKGLRLRSVILNQPVTFSSATFEWRPDGRRLTIASAEAFGTRWKGSIARNQTQQNWSFDLSADRLDLADLDRWLGPRARSGFLERMMASNASGAPPVRDAAIEAVRAQGKLHVGELVAAPLTLERLETNVELKGRSLTLHNAHASFFEGRIAGDVDAQLSAEPAYTFRGQLDRVNLGSLTSSPVWPEGRFSGTASGEVSFAARGIGKARLLESFSGQGNLRVRDPQWRGLDLTAPVSLATESRSPNESRFVSAIAGFRVSGRQLRIDQIVLATRDERLEVRGSMDFTQQLDLRMWILRPGADAKLEPERDSGREEWSVKGTLDMPLVMLQTRIVGNSVPSPGLAPARH